MRLVPGEPAPWFTANSTRNEQFKFDTAAGRYLVLCFFGSGANTASRRVLDDIEKNRRHFTDENVLFCGVSTDPEDQRRVQVPQPGPGVLYFWDFDRNISRLYGAVDRESADSGSQERYQRFTIVLDERLRTLAVFPFDDHPETHVQLLLQFLGTLTPIADTTGHAPIMIVPTIFEPQFCRELIQLYEEHGGEDSGFMRDVNGKTVALIDYSHKRRRDYDITDERVRNAAMVRIHDRLVPEIQKAFQFRATRMERYIVCCYDAQTGDHFRRHRDNTTKGTAHRRFAVTINLNTGEFEGGNLRFPEYGPQTYCAPIGGAVVFSCSLLHEATAVTQGRRFVFLPFLYDDAAAKIREENVRFLQQPS